MNVLHEMIAPDGGYSALVKMSGVEWAVHYIKGEIRVGAVTPVCMKNWKVKSAPGLVKKLVALKLKSFAPEWHAAHEALYAEPA
jgi:hypothetical protein